jgi:hypothetical protein
MLAGRQVSREYYSASDMDTDRAVLRPNPTRHLVTMIDVDFYLDLPTLLGECPANYFLYTFDVQAPAGTIVGDPYTFKDGRMIMDSGGSQRWTHGLWNFSSDHIVVVDRRHWTQRYGLVHAYVTYKVTKRTLAQGRVCVLLQPMAFVSEPSFASLMDNPILSKRSAFALSTFGLVAAGLFTVSRRKWKGLTPLSILSVSTFCGLAARQVLAPKELNGSRLQRVAPRVFTDPVSNRRLLCFTVRRNGLSYLSVAYEGDTCASTLDERLVAVARSMWENQSTKLTTASLLTKIQVEAQGYNEALHSEIKSLEKSKMQQTRDMDSLHAKHIPKLTMLDAVLLHAYLRALCPPSLCVVKPHPLRRVNVGSFIFENEYTFESENSGLSAFMPAMFDSAVTFAQNRENEIDTVAKRVEETRTYVTDLTTDLEIQIDFLARKFLLPNNGVRLMPDGDEIVYENQDSERKKINLQSAREQNIFAPLDDLVRAFQKSQAEHFRDNVSARNITNFNQAVKLFGSMFAKPVDRLLRLTGIYSGGMTPRQVAERVASICTGAQRVVLGDVRRLDGSTNDRCRTAYSRFLRALYDPCVLPYLLRLLEILQKNTVVTRHGVKYKQGFTIGSGGPDTSVLGSLLNIFVHFTAAVDYFRDLEKGWEWLTTYLGVQGDDSLSTRLPTTHIADAATLWGLTYKLEAIEQYDYGVNYLNRYYTSAVFNGDPNSVSNPMRAIEKFHLVSKTDILDPVTIAIQKSLGYFYGDANTPFLV